MILFIHIISALSGLFYSAYVFFHPSRRALNVVYGLLASTIGTGTYLVLAKPVHMLQTCVEGLVYVGLILGGVFATQKKLAKQRI